MADTAYDLLKKKADAAENKWKALQAELSKIRTEVNTDSRYAASAKAIGHIDTAANASNGTALKTGSGKSAKYYGRYDVWAYSDGTIYHNSSTPSMNAAERDYLRIMQAKVSSKQHEVDQAKMDYDTARVDLEKYEATSPLAATIV